ncbi:MAG: hypothetical protein Q8Q31_05655 [Nanoarchaeota archaeon]|nr:hypothetical protein [Nanoarchaeota archaeon]
MIKKNTQIIFEGEKIEDIEALEGGIPLSIGEIINIHQGDNIIQFMVKDKKVDCFLEGKDQVVNIIYKLIKNK